MTETNGNGKTKQYRELISYFEENPERTKDPRNLEILRDWYYSGVGLGKENRDLKEKLAILLINARAISFTDFLGLENVEGIQ